ncbi:MAG: META domain-containing protein [Capsulimonadales bacterium]|nr:META domain-containing protein [Capsulimonadales bacterium]
MSLAVSARWLRFSILLIWLVSGVSSIRAQSFPRPGETWDSKPLGVFALGRWQRVRLTSEGKGKGTLILDPNRAAWDGFSPAWRSTRMAEVRLPIRFQAVKAVNRSSATPQTTAPRLYDLLPEGKRSLAASGIGPRLRLVTATLPTGPQRLLEWDAERITRVVALERSPRSVVALPETDRFAFKSTFLGRTWGRTALVSISGSLKDRTGRLVLDGNAMIPDPFGDPSISTMMAPIPQEVTLAERKGLPSTVMARVFTLEGAKPPMSLVLERGGAAARLVLQDTSGKATGFLTLEPDRRAATPLFSSEWRLVEIVGARETITPTEEEYSLRFLPDGRIVGRAGVNRIAGFFGVAEDHLVFSPLVSTRAAALNPTVESAFLTALSKVRSFRSEGEELRLLLAGEVGAIVLKRVPLPSR